MVRLRLQNYLHAIVVLAIVGVSAAVVVAAILFILKGLR